MTFESTRFNMGSVMNKLRAIAETQPEITHHDPGMETGGQEIDNASFTRTMQRLAAIKDAVAEDHYNALRAGVRSLYMNRRPNLQQMTALMDLLETVLSYVAEDNALFQRLKSDLARDRSAQGDQEAGAFPTGAAPKTAQAPEVGAPGTAEPVKQAEMRPLKA
jgi:hypothetical protein